VYFVTLAPCDKASTVSHFCVPEKISYLWHCPRLISACYQHGLLPGCKCCSCVLRYYPFFSCVFWLSGLTTELERSPADFCPLRASSFYPIACSFLCRHVTLGTPFPRATMPFCVFYRPFRLPPPLGPHAHDLSGLSSPPRLVFFRERFKHPQLSCNLHLLPPASTLSMRICPPPPTHYLRPSFCCSAWHLQRFGP